VSLAFTSRKQAACAAAIQHALSQACQAILVRCDQIRAAFTIGLVAVYHVRQTFVEEGSRPHCERGGQPVGHYGGQRGLVRNEVVAWEAKRNSLEAKGRWRFTTERLAIQVVKLYSVLEYLERLGMTRGDNGHGCPNLSTKKMDNRGSYRTKA
jgi:hypothetical protein